MTATDDPTIPDRGDRVLMVGGQFWAVSQERLLPLTPVQPAMRNVSMEIEF